MDFWGVEVKSGEPYHVEPGQGWIVHLSQACLGEFKKDKGSERVYLYVTIDGKKLVLGTLSPEKFPQLQFDLVFDKKFELSHNWKNGVVYFYGYKCNTPFDDTEDDSESESEEDLPALAVDKGKGSSQAKHEKPPAIEDANMAMSNQAAAKQKAKVVEPKKDAKTVENDDVSSEDGIDTETSDDEFDSDEDEDDSESEDEETPVTLKVEPSKKRPPELAAETRGPDKKAKLVTPQKTDTKKGGGSSGHVATPHPSKQAGKAPANQPKQQTPKSAGSHPCKSCNRSFNSEIGLQSHTKAKHSAGK
ncbi:histone deacetylase HDT1-like [Diospyros lotus]|uniref:histone deacetylase HDT1-like n=1 Tax=Diospyros lotus TaxID=55363 RepID=UPI00225BD1BC|nr:histone deacetylase HDT1-like [Diospyros lotus]